MVVREEPSGIRRYSHVGTGNYNPKTARSYEDIGLFSADNVLGEDLNRLFNQLSGFAPQSEFRRLLVAPGGIRSKLLEKIDREILFANSGKSAKIQMKLNAILDEEFVEALYRASKAGVKIDLIVRGICAIRAQVPNLSENITVRSEVRHPISAHLYLLLTFFSTYIQYFCGQLHGNLQQERTLPDSGLTTHEYQ